MNNSHFRFILLKLKIVGEITTLVCFYDQFNNVIVLCPYFAASMAW